MDSLADTLDAGPRGLEGIVLAAESYSGTVGARVPSRLGQKVGLLVLCNPLVEMSVGFPAGLAASFARWQGLPAWMAGAVLAGGDRALGKAALDGIRALPKEILGARLASAFTATEEDLAQLLAAPLPAVLGLRDRLVSPERTKPLLQTLPFSTVVEFDAPHLVVQTKPAEVREAITGEFEFAA